MAGEIGIQLFSDKNWPDELNDERKRRDAFGGKNNQKQ